MRAFRIGGRGTSHLHCFIGILLFPLMQLNAAAQKPLTKDGNDRPEAIRSYGKLPLSFEENRGQADPQVKYLAHGARYSILLTGTKALITFTDLHTEFGQSARRALAGPGSGPGHVLIADLKRRVSNARRDAIQMELVGSEPGVEVTGENPLPGTANYFIGDDSARWHIHVPTYSKVKYSEVYRGVDLVYYGDQQRLEYDFVLAPHADAGIIGLRFNGAEHLTINDRGDLDIQTQAGSIGFRKPNVYQMVEGRRITVGGSFRLAGHNTVRFLLGTYDHTKALVIDPILIYSTYLDGPTGDSDPFSLAVDAQGNAFIVGLCDSDFPTTTGAFQSTAGYTGGVDPSVCVSKLSSDGSSLLYSTFLEGTSAFVYPSALAIDSDDNVYVVGYTTETDFPTTQGAFQQTNPAGMHMGFVSKLNSTGSGLLYSTYLGGTNSINPTNPGLPQNVVYGVAVDGTGDAFVTGFTYSSDFPTTPGAFQTTFPAGNTNGTSFVAKLNSSGTQLLYGTFLGGSSYEAGTSIVVDSEGEAIDGGTTGSINFPTTAGAFQSSNKAEPLNNGTVGNNFITKLNPAGGGLVYSTLLGGSTSEQLAAVTLDSTGSVYVTGTTFSKDFPVTQGAFQTSEKGGWVGFVTKMSSDGSALVYSTFLGGTVQQSPAAIAVDSFGDAYIAGYTGSADFPVTPGAFETFPFIMAASAQESGFISEINPTGAALVYSTFVSGSGNMAEDGGDGASGIALDSSGNVYVTGITSSEDFPTTPGAYMTQLEADGGMRPGITEANSVFITKFNKSEMTPLPLSTTTVTASPNPQLPLNSVAYTAHVAPSNGGTLPTGLIGFDLDGYIWSTATLDATGSASYSSPSSAMILGPNSMNVIYLGDANNAPSHGSLTENIALYPTTTTFTVSPTSSTYGTPITLNVTVTSTPQTPFPIGSVTFTDNFDAYPPITVPLDATGHAATTVSNLPVGANTITARYLPSDIVHAASQASVSETILPPPAPQSPTFTPAPGSYSAAQSVALSDSTSGVTICYTTDGTQPAALCQQLPIGSTTLYTNPIPVSQTTTINALAVAGSVTPSPVSTGIYIFGGLPPAFTITTTPVDIAPGAATGNTSSITVSPTGGFTGTVTLNVAITSSPSGAQDPPFLSLEPPSPLTFTGPTDQSATLTITTTAPSNAMGLSMHRALPLYPAGGAALACLLLGWRRPRRRTCRTTFGLIVLLLFLEGAVLACGSGGDNSGGGGGGRNPGTTAGNYVITVTGTSGTTAETKTVNLTVE